MNPTKMSELGSRSNPIIIPHDEPTSQELVPRGGATVTNPDPDTNPLHYLSMPVLHQQPTASSALYYVRLDLILTQQDLFVLVLFLWVLFTN